MKKTLVATLAMTCALGAFAQGTITFNNRTGGTSHVWGGGNSQIRGNTASDTPAGSTVYPAPLLLIGTTGSPFSAATTFAALLGGPNAGALQQGNGAQTTFRTGTGSGNIVQTTATFNNIAPDAAQATFQMVAWDNSSGLYNSWATASVAWQAGLIAAGSGPTFDVLSIGGVNNTPPNMNGQQSFNIYIIPEPTTIALAGLGAAALVIFRRRKA